MENGSSVVQNNTQSIYDEILEVEHNFFVNTKITIKNGTNYQMKIIFGDTNY